MPIRILLAEDHVMVRQGLRVLLERAGMVVIGEASDGQEALRLAHEYTPDVAVLDIAMPSLNGLETARRLRETLPQTKIVVLTMYTEEP
jgi:DNA-binding NarL/FixJ family response regulator